MLFTRKKMQILQFIQMWNQFIMKYLHALDSRSLILDPLTVSSRVYILLDYLWSKCLCVYPLLVQWGFRELCHPQKCDLPPILLWTSQSLPTSLSFSLHWFSFFSSCTLFSSSNTTPSHWTHKHKHTNKPMLKTYTSVSTHSLHSPHVHTPPYTHPPPLWPTCTVTHTKHTNRHSVTHPSLSGSQAR